MLIEVVRQIVAVQVVDFFAEHVDDDSVGPVEIESAELDV
jgi:hypothetical protein